MKRILLGVAMVGLVIFFIALVALCNWWVGPENENAWPWGKEINTKEIVIDDAVEIGWRPIVSSKIENEGSSGVAYVLITINGQTNDVMSYRECFLNEYSAASGRTNPETGVWEVYVVAKEFKYPVPHQQYFAMRYARSLRK